MLKTELSSAFDAGQSGMLERPKRYLMAWWSYEARDRHNWVACNHLRVIIQVGNFQNVIACCSQALIATLLFDPSMSALPSHGLWAGIPTLRLTLVRVDISRLVKYWEGTRTSTDSASSTL
jgi:hypothetical protein